MATVIDALIVTLGLDAKAFDKGAKGVKEGMGKLGGEAEKHSKDIEKLGKQMAESLNKAKQELISLIAVAMGATGIKDLIANVTSGNVTLGQLSKNLSMSARDIDAWGAAAESVGGSADGMRQSMQAMQSGFTAFRLGEQSPVVTAFRALGVEIADSKTGKMRDFADMFLDLSDAIKKLDPQKQLAAAKMLGWDTGTLALARQSRDEILQTLDKMRRLSGVTDENVEGSRRLQAAWAELKQGGRGVANELVTSMVPALEALAALATSLVKMLQDLHQATDGWSSRIIAAGVALAGVVTTLRTLLSLRALLMGAGAANAAAGAAGAAGAGAASVGLAGAAGLGLAGLFTGWQIWRLLGAYGELKDVQNREGVKLTPEAQARVNGALPRGMRNNNPGNIEFAGQAGAELERPGGRFARFGSMEQGVAAMVRQLRLYASRGVNTLRQIIRHWAPANENNTDAYIADLMRQTGFGADQRLDMNDEATVRSLIRAMSKHENKGMFPSEDQITGGIRIGAGAGRSAGTGTKVETNINGPITINTKATDAPGIARDLHGELQKQTTLSMGATGMS